MDNRLRALLIGHRLPWSLVAGRGAARVESAVDALAPLLRGRASTKTGLFTRLAERDAAQPIWQQNCDNCDSPECEHALMRQRHSPDE